MIFSFRPRPAASGRASLVFFAAFGLLLADAAAANARSRPRREADDAHAYRGVIVTDAATGDVLFEDKADYSGPPASMTKLMTYAVLHDKLTRGELTLDTMVQIDRSDTRMGGTQVYLDPRETFSVEELIYAMMIRSANDAAHALARISAGSVPAFVELMNQKAQELGMTQSTFRTPHGLPPDNRRVADSDLTTPRDFAKLCRHLVLRTDVLKYTAVRERMFAPDRQVGNPIKMENHNVLVGSVAGVDGLKTGYTKGAGYCLSATAERRGRRVITVIMGSFGPGGRIDEGVTRNLKAVELLERGFAALPTGSPTFANERAKYVKPAVISLDGPSVTAPAAAGATDEAPSVKFNNPRRR